MNAINKVVAVNEPAREINKIDLAKVFTQQLCKIIFNLNEDLLVTTAGEYDVRCEKIAPSTMCTGRVSYKGCKLYIRMPRGTALPDGTIIERWW